LRVGILAVQGDYEAHGEMLARLGVEHCFVKTPEDLEECEALILPGGESTTQLQFLQEEGLIEGIRALAARGGSIFGTCAGAILLAREVRNPPQASLGLLDVTITRNAYGRQLSSEVRVGTSKLASGAASETEAAAAPLEMVFIRAPIIERVGPGVEVLAESQGKPVLVRQGRVLAATFHPELTSDTTVHAAFLKIANEREKHSQNPNTTANTTANTSAKTNKSAMVNTPHEVHS
jgi:5'-phosphate synthase pdxT subunit